MAKHLMRHLPPAAQAPKPLSVAQRAARYLGGFLALMVLFTLLSRAADELTIPRVRLAMPSEGTIDRTITGFGKVEAISAQAVTTQPGIRVAGISVKAGAWVEEGEPLFTLDSGDLSDKLASAQEELERQDMDISDRASREALESQEQAKAIERAGQDYAAAQKSAGQEVARAKKALDDAKAALSAASPPSVSLAALEAACAQCDAELLAAQAELDRLEAVVSAGPLQAYETGEPEDEPVSTPSPLDAARERLAAAHAAKAEADAALAAYRDSAAQYEQLQDSVELAQDAYDRAVDARENSLRAASRQIEDAERPKAQDSSGLKAQLDRDRQADKVAKLEELLDAGGLIRAPFSGTVTGINVTVGSPTPEGTALLLSGEENGCIFTAQLSSEQEKYLAPGDEATVKPGGGRRDIEDLEIEAIAPSSGGGTLDVTIRLPEGSLPVGAAAELEVLRRSRNYPCLVPLSALHEEGGNYFLLVVQEKATLLGTELTAGRRDVTLLEKNESYAAIEAGALERGQGFLNYSSKPVNAGDRIRLEAP